MSASEPKTWLICYDIREPRRLRRVHRVLRTHGATVQYSAFAVRASDHALADLLALLRDQIDARVDDVRAYHVPARCKVWALGTQNLADGIEVDATTAAHLLLANAGQPEPTPEDLKLS